MKEDCGLMEGNEELWGTLEPEDRHASYPPLVVVIACDCLAEALRKRTEPLKPDKQRKKEK